MYRYFVSYVHADDRWGYGNFEIKKEKPITSIQDIHNIEQIIGENHGLKPESVVVLNFIKFEDN